MQESTKKFIGSTVAILTIIILHFVLPEYSWENTGIAILGGLATGIFAHTFQIIDLLKEHSESTMTNIENHIKKIIDIVKINNDFFNDRWLFETLEQIVYMVRFANNNPHELERAQKILDDALKQAKQNIGAKFYEENIENGEIGRMLLLNKAIANAKSYVSAVSYDQDGYFDNFWTKLNAEYLELNVKAARHRGVLIERVFVMDAATLKDSKNPKNKKLRQIINELKKGGKNVKNYVVSKDELQLYNPPTSSFFICDDILACESQTKDNNNYYVMNDSDMVKKLKNRFEAYKLKAQAW